MKRNIFLTTISILVLIGGISYLLIWIRNKKAADTLSETDSNTDNTGDYSSQILNTGSLQPTQETLTGYEWWENKLGRAGFPLKYGSKGVEVVKLQEELNLQSDELGWNLISVDGIWGNETQQRFQMLYTGYASVTEYMFLQEFDPLMQVLN